MAPSKNTDREAREARDRLRRYTARQTVHTHQSKRRVRDNVLALIGLIVVATLATFTQIYYFSAGPGKPAAKSSATPTPTPTAAGSNIGNVPSASVAEARTWTGDLTLNSVKLGISLDGKAAPQAVASFVTDAKGNYFDGLLCWRLTNSANFDVLQCGTSSATGADASQYSFGPLENTPSDNKYPAGSIVEARTSDNAYGSGHQFFITYKDTTIPADSAGGYSIFGHVTSGLDQLISDITSKGIVPPASGDTSTNKNDGPPVVTTKITSVTIK
ncbi:MAG: peptidyl-prolyl cis-trans isomerase [Actinomycetota bacterium]|nr:peptidyl-prolyl cis-trans isomerase [Actinomycetota bacterium]